MPEDIPQPAYDVIGYGVAAVDEMIELHELPKADVKVDIRSHQTLCGGICVNALAAAAKLGMRCHYAGPLGENDLSAIIREGMLNAGITSSRPNARPDAGPSHAFILVDRSTGTRTILMNKARVQTMTVGDLPEELIRSTRALYVDSWHLEAGLTAVRIARQLGVQVIADFEEFETDRVRPLLPYVDHLILPLHYAQELAGATLSPDALVTHLHDDVRRCTAVTIGDRGSWFLSGDATIPVHQPAFAIDIVDTTGCGDAFHGAYIAAFLNGNAVKASIRYASAAAALSARAIGAQSGLATDAEVRELLTRSPAAHS